MPTATRRIVVALAVGLLLPAALGAQPAPRIRVGILSTGAPRTSPNYVASIQRLGDLGYVGAT